MSYADDVAKKVAAALRSQASEIESKIKNAASKGGSAKASTSNGSITVNTTFNIAAPSGTDDPSRADSDPVSKKLEERENVYLQREAAKAGFYGGSNYARQMASRFRNAGYAAAGVGDVLAYASHYSGNTAGTFIDAAAGGVGFLKQVLPLITAVIKENAKEAELAAKGVVATPSAILAKAKMAHMNLFGSKKEQDDAKREYELLVAGVASQSDYLLKALRDTQSKLQALQASVVSVQEGVKAAWSTALLAISLGERSPNLEMIRESFEGGGDYESYKFLLRDWYDQKRKEMMGPAVVPMVQKGMKELERMMASAFR